MYSYDHRTAALYNRLFVAMTTDEAKELLGFPPGHVPSPSEVNKAYRDRLKKDRGLHPDQGGSHMKMVELNVAKDILEGKRREDRTPYTPPKKDPSVERREKLDRDLRVVASEAEQATNALEPALNELDITRGRLHLPSFLTHDYGKSLDQIHDEIEANHAKTPDWMKAKALVHTLTGMSARLAARSAALTKRLLDMYGLHLTYKDVADLHAETAKFIVSFQEFAAESGLLMKLIVTSEAVPMTWDVLYSHNHQILNAFRDDFKNFGDHGLKNLGGRLQRAVMVVTGILASHGQKLHENWETWRIPGDFLKAAEMLKSSSASN